MVQIAVYRAIAVIARIDATTNTIEASHEQSGESQVGVRRRIRRPEFDAFLVPCSPAFPICAVPTIRRSIPTSRHSLTMSISEMRSAPQVGPEWLEAMQRKRPAPDDKRG